MTEKSTYEELEQRVRALEYRDCSSEPSSFPDAMSLLDGLVKAQARFIQGKEPHLIFDGLLNAILEYTNSQYGYIGEVAYEDDGTSYQLSRAISNLAWNEDTRKYYEENWHSGLRFESSDTLFGIVTKTGQVVIANDLSNDPRSKGVPPGHPEIKTFLGVPIFHKDKIVGSIGLANRANGYDSDLVKDLQPFVSTCSVILSALRIASERKVVEKALKESEKRYQTIFQTTPAGIVISDLENGKIIESNDTICKITGHKYQEILGKTSIEIGFWPNIEDREKITSMLKEEGKFHNLEFDYCNIKGEPRTGLFSSEIVDISNRPCIITAMVDITGHRRAESALVTSERKWRNVLVNTPQIGVALNVRAEIVFANEHFLELTGWKEEELIGQNWFDMFIPEQVREEVRNVFHTVMSQKDTLGYSTYENEIIGKSGERFNVSWSNVLSKDASGNVVDVTCLGVDLTERRRVEDKLKRSETKYRTMMEAIEDPVYICSEDNRIQYMNQAMLDRVGYDAIGELCYRALHDFEEKCPWCEYKGTFMEGHKQKSIVSPKDNRSFNVSSTVFRNEYGSLSKISVFRDTTAFTALQNRLQQAQKMESIGTLAGGIAHDFNNILFPIIGLSELLLEDLPPDGMEHENVRQVLKAARRGSQLVEQILAFSRQYEHKMRPFPMQLVLKEVLKLSRSTIPTNIGIRQDIQADCGLIVGDPTQVHQIAMNLITNAYHAVETNGGSISIHLRETTSSPDDLPISSVKPGNYARLRVSDTGCGIDPRHMEKIFEPYFTTKAQGKGTGLGLAVAYGIIKEHGGHIKVQSELGKGSVFDVYFPLLEKSGKRKSPEAPKAQPAGSERILLVDDEEAVVHLEKQLLERLGYTVTAFTSSEEALKAFNADPNGFELVLTDMAMPDLAGDQLAMKILSIRPGIPIILCTGFSERINEREAYRLGISGLLRKPVAKSDIAGMVRKILDETKRKPLI